MEFSETLKNKKDSFDVVLGFNKNDILTINLKKNPTVIITGATGTSKSTMMHEILLQLINQNKDNELKIITISPTKVELKPYEQSNYSYNQIISDKKEALNQIKEINELILERKKLFLNNNVKNLDEYNKLNEENLEPFIVIAIDEATDILTEKNSEDELLKLINNCKDHGIILIMNTNNVYNSFFEKNINTLADIKISFDFTTEDESELTNLKDCQNLSLKTFLIKVKNDNIKEYEVINFDDSYIQKILN